MPQRNTFIQKLKGDVFLNAAILLVPLLVMWIIMIVDSFADLQHKMGLYGIRVSFSAL